MDYPKDKTISQLFEEQVLKTPDNISVVFGDKSLSYKELNELSNRLANYLIESNMDNTSTISIHLEKSINYIISILAVLKIGATFVPISTMHPKSRIEYILKNSKTNLLISEKSLAQKFDFSCFLLDITEFNYSAYHKANLNIELSSDDRAYILYTSGSTGKPKGVQICNYSVINHIYGINQKFNNQINTNDNALSIANISFDAHLQEIFIPILFGATLHLLSDDSIFNIKYLTDYIVENKITFTFLPPNILDDVYKLLSKSNHNIYLNKLLVGVESISYSTLNNFFNLNENMQIHNRIWSY